MSDEHYDIFISYARDDSTWVREQLYRPLLEYTLADGKLPRIFLDISELGIIQGENYLIALGRAIQKSQKVILVYSKTYFHKEMTSWELTKALQLDPSGKKLKVNPILINPEAESEIPFEINHIQYLDTRNPDWFSRLVKNMGLVRIKESEPPSLSFLTHPEDIAVHNTLPRMEVALSNRGEKNFREEAVSLSAPGAELQGTLTVKTSGGVAFFSDLSFKSKAAGIYLVAEAKGYRTGKSAPFSVFEHVVRRPVEPRPKGELPEKKALYGLIPSRGCTDVVFFASGRALAAVSSSSLSLFDTEGGSLGQMPLGGPIRFIRQGDGVLAAALWTGEILILRENRERSSYRFSGTEALAPGTGYSIPADCALLDGSLVVGFWNGNVFQITAENQPRPVLSHPQGVQALGASEKHLVFADFEGKVHAFHHGACVFQDRLEQTILGIQLFEKAAVIIGEDKAYQVSLESFCVVTETLPLSTVSSVYRGPGFLLAIDEAGKGVRLDQDLVIREQFHTTAGARPLSSDNTGRHVVFLYPSGFRTLMRDGRIVYTHYSGALSIDLSASRLVIGDDEGLRIRDISELSELYKGGLR
ncbi:MAG: hypothetical protein AMJ94_00130 [Deltaproteobacteria bacterium SM23_61]|nr:MAG: hypothetical protein AMJ94_00130 [Deltaproteobacteria bacterium SM23_61]